MKSKRTSLLSIIEIAVIILMALMIACMVIIHAVFKSDGSPGEIFGANVFRVTSEMMKPKIPKETVILAKQSEIENIAPNSVILCYLVRREGNEPGEAAVIRVTEIQREPDGTYYVVRFDQGSETFRIPEENVIAKAVWQLNSFGNFLNFATSAPGIAVSIMIPLFFIILFQVIRIVNLRKLEEEASSIDDIDDFIFRRDADNPKASMTLTEPKFIEDITDKFPIIKAKEEERPLVPEYPRQKKPYTENRAEKFSARNVAESEIYSHKKEYAFSPSKPKEKPPAPTLSIDKKGRADYSASHERPSRDLHLFTFEELADAGKTDENRPVYSIPGRARASRSDIYLNRSATETADKSGNDKFEPDGFSKAFAGGATAPTASAAPKERVSFTPALSAIIPDSIARVQEDSVAPRQTYSDKGVRSYFDKPSERPAKPQTKEPSEDGDPIPTIPKNAKTPSESLAPPRKKKSNQAVEELMGIIDAAEHKNRKQ